MWVLEMESGPLEETQGSRLLSHPLAPVVLFPQFPPLYANFLGLCRALLGICCLWLSVDKNIKGCSSRETFPLDERLLAPFQGSHRERKTPERTCPLPTTQCPQIGPPCGAILHLTQHGSERKAREAVFGNNKLRTELSPVSRSRRPQSCLTQPVSASAGCTVCCQSGRAHL